GQLDLSGDGHAARAAGLAFPNGLAVDAAGNLFIADNWYPPLVRRVSPDGVITTVTGGGNAKVMEGASATAIALSDPFELAVDATGNLLIGDSGLNRILKVTPGGKISIIAGTGQARFSADGGLATKTPIDGSLAMAMDSAGDLFFADMNRIRK